MATPGTTHFQSRSISHVPSVTNHQSRLSSTSYSAPWWLPGGNAQTVYAALAAPRPHVAYHRERWDTPDGDFIDLDWIDPPSVVSRQSSLDERPLVVLFHGLEGSSRSHYALALMAAVRDRGLRGVVAHFRGCGGELN